MHFNLFLISCAVLNLVLICDSANDTVIINLSNSGENVTAERNLTEYELSSTEQNSSNYSQIAFSTNLKYFYQSISVLPKSKCQEDLYSVYEGALNKKLWALQLFDSFPKVPVGILYGSSYQLGNFDECTTIKEGFHGQYCLTDISIDYKNKRKKKIPRDDFNNTIHWAVCVPSTCSTKEIQLFVKEIFHNFIPSTDVNVLVDEYKCTFVKKEPFTTLEIVYVSIVLNFIVFVLLATAYHLLHTCKGKLKSSSTIHKVWFSFSVIENTRKIFSVKETEYQMNFISGIKFISMSFIIAGHSILFVFGGPVSNPIFLKEAVQKYENAIFLNTLLLVDTFLMLSGFLMCKIMLTILDKRGGGFNFIFLYIGRYIRLTPSYLVVIGLYASFLVRFGEGPFWKSKIGIEQERCLNSWWTNILYINNYMNTDNLCMFQSWYLAVDSQLFVIAPFYIYTLWKWKRFGEILLGLSTLIAVVIPFALTLINGYDPTLMIYAPEITDISSNTYFNNVYIKTHLRASSYFIGLLFGYVIYKLDKNQCNFGRLFKCSCWIMAVIFGVFSMFSVTIFYWPDHNYNPIESAFYSALNRVGWCLAIGWVLTYCIIERSSYINKFLSWSPFVPLSRLTYCAYLLNGLIELISIGKKREPQHLSVFSLSEYVISHIILTFAAAFILCVFFESPIHSLEKILQSKEKIPGGNNNKLVPNNIQNA